MRVSAIIVAALATVAAAHSSAEHSGDHTETSAPTPTGADPATQSLVNCLDKCDSSDVNCIAHCVGVPSPNDDQANENTACAAKCDQGDGSEADTQAFGECLLKCRGEHFFSEGHGTPNPTGSSNNNGSGDSSDDDSASATGTGSGSSQETGSPTEEESGSESGSASGTAGNAQSTGDNGSGAMALSALTSASLFGFVAAFFL